MTLSGSQVMISLSVSELVLIPLLVDDPLWAIIVEYDIDQGIGLNPSFSG